MPLTDDQYRQGAIEYASHYCKQQFEDGKLPFGVEVAVDLLIKAMKENPGVQSQSLGDMSKSFFKNGTHDAAVTYLKPYRKIRFG